VGERKSGAEESRERAREKDEVQPSELTISGFLPCLSPHRRRFSQQLRALLSIHISVSSLKSSASSLAPYQTFSRHLPSYDDTELDLLSSPPSPPFFYLPTLTHPLSNLSNLTHLVLFTTSTPWPTLNNSNRSRKTSTGRLNRTR